MVKIKGRYTAIIEQIFQKYYRRGQKEIQFERDDIIRVARELNIDLPKNIGDLIYSFRYRADLPESINSKVPTGCEWLIIPKGTSKYAFVARKIIRVVPNEALAETKIPDATPGVISRYALNDEQALLAIIRYNRLVDIFSGVTCYSLQSHLRTTVPGIGQIETDEVYVGVDKKGVHYIFPVQAKSHRDKIGIIQIEQDFAMSKKKFPKLICIPIAAQFMNDEVIAMFQFEYYRNEIKLSHEKHYLLVAPDELSDEDLAVYQKRKE
jgi:hypothetical protein